MKKISLKHNSIFSVILFWLLILMLFSLIFSISICGERLTSFNGTLSYQEPQWMFGEKGRDAESVRLSDVHTFEPGKVYVLSTDLTYDGEADAYPSAFIINGNLEIQVFLGEKLLFHYTCEDKIFPSVQSIGGTTFSVPMGENCKDGHFRIELRTPMKHAVRQRLPSITFGDHETQIRFLFMKSLPSILIGSAITFAVMILVLLGNTIDGTQWTYIYFSLFAIQIVICKSMQDLFIQYIWGKPFLSAMLNYFSIVACPIPLLMSYRCRIKPHCAKAFHVLIGISSALLIMQVVLHFTGVKDVTEMTLLTHTWALAAAVSMMLIGFSVKKATGEKMVLRKLMPILIGAILELLMFYLHKYFKGPVIYYSVGNLISLGLLISLILIIWEARQARINAYREAERNAILEKAAYTDSLTGIKNRAALTKKLIKIATGKIQTDDMLVVSADLNGLKQTNDTMGHTAGDILIRRGAEVLCSVLSPLGEVYRTGGDEFFAILEHVPEEQWTVICDSLEKKIEEINSNEDISLSIAVGAAALKDGNINQAIQLSDQRMYRNKENQHKANQNI